MPRKSMAEKLGMEDVASTTATPRDLTKDRQFVPVAYDRDFQLEFGTNEERVAARRLDVARMLRGGGKPKYIHALVNRNYGELAKELAEKGVPEEEWPSPVSLSTIREDVRQVKDAWREDFVRNKAEVGGEMVAALKQVVEMCEYKMVYNKDPEIRLKSGELLRKTIETLARVYGIVRTPQINANKVETKTQVTVVSGQMPTFEVEANAIEAEVQIVNGD